MYLFSALCLQIDCILTRPYDRAVFSGQTFLPLELVRIGAIAFFYCLSIFGWGHVIAHHLRISLSSFADFLLVRVVVGCSALYAFFILLCLGSVLHPTAVLTVLLFGVAAAFFQVRPAFAKLRAALGRVPEWDTDQQVLFAMLCCFVLLQLVCGFTPLTFYDSQVYHLLAPVQFLQAGTLVHIPWNVLTNGPMALQLVAGMSWVADPTGNTFKLLMTILGCLAVLAAARMGSVLGARAAIVAALFVAAYPEFWINQTFGSVDLAAAAFLLFGAIWWMEALRLRQWNLTILAGTSVGFSVGSRYQGLVLAAWILSAIFIADSFRNRRVSRGSMVKCIVVAILVTAMVCPWLIRNYSNYGNPVFPFMQAEFGSPEWSADQASRLQAFTTGASLGEISARQLIVAPIGALLISPNNGLFGAALLLGSLLCLWAGDRSIRMYAVLGIGGLVLWGLIQPVSTLHIFRYNAASLVLMLACTGAILGSERLIQLKGAYVAGILAVASFLIAIVSLHDIIPAWRLLTSSTAREEYTKANIPSWQIFNYANDKLDPARHKILMIGETRGLWLNIPFLAPSAFNGPQLMEVFQPSSEPERWISRLHQLRVTHLLICSSEWQRLADRFGYFRLDDDHLSRLNTWLHTLPVLFDDRRGNVLLAIPSD